MAERETRVMLGTAEYRKDGDGPAEIMGMGALYNVETVIAGRFREVILPGAFTRTVADDDIVVLYNHDADHLLGRKSAGTAEFRDEPGGMAYRAILNPRDSDAMNVGAKVERGDLKGSSFSFTVDHEDDEEWTPRSKDNPMPLRKIKRATVYDVGPVTFPAYVETSVSARSLARADELTAAEAKRLEEVEAAKTPEARSIDSLLARIAQAKAWRP